MKNRNKSLNGSSRRWRRPLAHLAFVALLALPATTSNAGLISSNTGASESGLGSFTGSIGVSNNTATTATITVMLTNTSPLANGGFITAFAFNDPGTASGGDIERVTGFTATDPDFDLLGGPVVSDSIKAVPLGDFDIGASISGDFLGGGNPNPGLGVGESATFTFNVTGTNLLNLSQASLEAALTDGSGGRSSFFAVRFRGFEDGGSDKVPAEPDDVVVSAVPEPGTITMALIGSIPLGLTAWRRRRRAIA